MTARTSNKLTIIPGENSKQFIAEFNANKISKELIESSRIAGQLFKGGSNRKGKI